MKKGIFNNFYQYLIDRFEGIQGEMSLPEPELIAQKRRQAFDRFMAGGFPSRKHEEWKYTDLAKFLGEEFKFQHTSSPAKGASVINGLDAYKVVFVNGRIAEELSDALPEGIRLLSTEAALADPVYAAKLGTIAGDDENTMLALNTAFFKDYYVLHVTAKAVIERPVHISHIYTDQEAATFIPYRMLVLADKLSEATLIETFETEAQVPVFVNYVSEQQLEESAVFHSHMVHNMNESVHFIHHREVIQFKHSVLNNSNITLGTAALIRNDLNFRLSESGTETNLLGAYLLTGKEHVDNHTLVDHQAPHCNSNELYKGILLDTSQAVFNGKVYVQPDAQKTNAFQQNNNLLLSDKATVNSKPQLEIFADDVKCSHGCTIGQMNDEALFYLKARGIGEDRANRLLMEAFVFDVLSKIEITALQEYTADLLHGKLTPDDLVAV